MDIGKAVTEIKAGKIDFKVDRYGIVHAAVGKTSFDQAKIKENAEELIKTLLRLKPSAAKGKEPSAEPEKPSADQQPAREHTVTEDTPENETRAAKP